MKTKILLLGSVMLLRVLAFAQTGLREDVVPRGPHAGDVVKIVSTEAVSTKALAPQEKSPLTLRLPGQNTNVQVELFAYRHNYTRTAGNRSSAHACYEFQVRSKDSDEFAWSCWTFDFPRPHDFQVLTTESGNAYACFIGAGVHLFRLSASRESDVLRRQFWEGSLMDSADHPDGLPVVGTSLLFQTLGRTNMFGMGPQTLNLTVDMLSDVAGELQVTVHGAAPTPQCTFALRDGAWVWVSTSSSPNGVTDAKRAAEGAKPPRRMAVPTHSPVMQRLFGGTNTQIVTPE
jgi:hypothetical protein